MESVILGLGVLVFLGHLLVAVFKRTRVPDVLLLMGVGIALGPFGLAWVKPESFGEVGPVMTAIALIVILFEGGLGTSLDTIARAAVGTASITLATAAVTVGLVAVVAHDHLGGWMPAFLAGAILSGTSSAVVMPMISALNLSTKARTILSLESALTDVTCIVLTVGLLDAALRGEASGVHLAGKAFSSMISAGALGVIGGIGWLLIHERLRAVPNTRLAIIAGVFVLYGVAETLGFSGGITALAFGITAAHFSRPDTPSEIGGVRIGRLADDERSLFSELVFLCKLVFFLYLGITLRFDSIEPYIVAALAVAAIYAARVLLARFLLPRDCSPRDAAIAAIMAPKGLAAAVIAASVAQAGAPNGEAIKDFAYAVVLVSIVTTSLLVPLVETPPARWLGGRFFSSHGRGQSSSDRLPPAPPAA
jgi:cell volume regulation protein A